MYWYDLAERVGPTIDGLAGGYWGIVRRKVKFDRESTCKAGERITSLPINLKDWRSNPSGQRRVDIDSEYILSEILLCKSFLFRGT